MSKAGWYPDPGGQAGLYRYWDGQVWSASVTSNPYTPPPATGVQSGATQSGVGPLGAQPYASGRPATRSGGGRGVWIVLGVALAAIGLVAAALLIPGVNPFGPPNRPVSNPTSEVCPVRKKTNESSAPQHGAGAGRVQGGKLSYPTLGAPWSAPREEDRLAFGRDVWSQTVLTEPNVNNEGYDWVASIVVGELVAGDGFFSPEDGSKIVTRCIVGTFYGNAEVQRTDKVNQAVRVGGKDAWLVEMHLTFDIRGLQEKGETAIVLIVATGLDSSSIYYASIPDSRPELLAQARQTQGQLRVEP